MKTGLLLLKKASKRTPFVFLIIINFLFLTNTAYASSCQPGNNLEKVFIDKVYDGDTVRLKNGKKLRLIGINTPERGRKGKPDQPFYKEAKEALKKLIHQNNNMVYVSYGEDRYDRHGRLLGHLFSPGRQNLAATLLENGLGYYLAIPPNIQLLQCYRQAEIFAAKGHKGIWAKHISQRTLVSLLPPAARGFYLITGTVHRVGESRSSYWLNLNKASDNRFALRILKKDLPYFREWHPKELLNKKITARGWIYIARKEQRMTIRHPASVNLH